MVYWCYTKSVRCQSAVHTTSSTGKKNEKNTRDGCAKQPNHVSWTEQMTHDPMTFFLAEIDKS